MSNKDIAVYAPPIGGDPIKFYVNGEEISLSVDSEVPSWGSNIADYGGGAAALPYSITDTNVVWEDGTILQYNGVDVLPTDSIVNGGDYTTRSNGGGRYDL